MFPPLRVYFGRLNDIPQGGGIIWGGLRKNPPPSVGRFDLSRKKLHQGTKGTFIWRVFAHQANGWFFQWFRGTATGRQKQMDTLQVTFLCLSHRRALGTRRPRPRPAPNNLLRLAPSNLPPPPPPPLQSPAPPCPASPGLRRVTRWCRPAAAPATPCSGS